MDLVVLFMTLATYTLVWNEEKEGAFGRGGDRNCWVLLLLERIKNILNGKVKVYG